MFRTDAVSAEKLSEGGASRKLIHKNKLICQIRTQLVKIRENPENEQI